MVTFAGTKLPWEPSLADLGRMLSAVLAEQHELRRLVHKMTVVVEVLTTEQAAARLGRHVNTLTRLAARRVFTDARPVGRQVMGSPRLYYADELEAYRSGGENGVKRLRKELGRP